MRFHRYRSRLWAATTAVAAACLAVTTLTAPAANAEPADNPAWGKELPQAGAPTSRAYDLIVENNDKGYTPRSGECSKEVHARYWAYGPDGKVYPTWHPPKDPSGCTFGHEHGDDPRQSELFSTVDWPTFGHTSEVQRESSPEHSHRHEDHVGHKVMVVNNDPVREGDDGTSVFPPTDGRVLATCDVLLKFHQGTHSADAFTNNVHELIYNNRCTNSDNGQTTEARYTALIPLGRPGGFGGTDCPGPFLGAGFRQVGTAEPADSPSDTKSLGRLITDASCVQAIREGKTHFEPLTGTYVPFGDTDLHEFWFADVTVSTSQLNFTIAPLFYVLNPSRYFDSSKPDNIGRQVDLCYEVNVQGQYCDQVRRQSGQRIAWDDVRSPFNGGLRQFRPGNFTVRNSGPTTVYTDVYGRNASTQPFEGSIKQYFSGNSSNPLYVRGTTKDWAANPSDRIHAPN
ncbi:hypothetical protein V1L54_05970 [Streptomyces sp. TRM 70361]|uniref:hypothetical protein n=1 Tax=Streptomyces sp. TRM 70361 TaxID=3116553 RepID=UPI002E7AC234|nr:hypothetical protein [Streptomyces sp. TRM 70361]MEE1938964.1 hypothetical protein [Streptomyces sp. TRM 70361]